LSTPTNRKKPQSAAKATSSTAGVNRQRKKSKGASGAAQAASKATIAAAAAAPSLPAIHASELTKKELTHLYKRLLTNPLDFDRLECLRAILGCLLSLRSFFAPYASAPSTAAPAPAAAAAAGAPNANSARSTLYKHIKPGAARREQDGTVFEVHSLCVDSIPSALLQTLLEITSCWKKAAESKTAFQIVVAIYWTIYAQPVCLLELLRLEFTPFGSAAVAADRVKYRFSVVRIAKMLWHLASLLRPLPSRCTAWIKLVQKPGAADGASSSAAGPSAAGPSAAAALESTRWFDLCKLEQMNLPPDTLTLGTEFDGVEKAPELVWVAQPLAFELGSAIYPGKRPGISAAPEPCG
jgi:hypothetical protein